LLKTTRLYDVRLQNYSVINFVPFFGPPCTIKVTNNLCLFSVYLLSSLTASLLLGFPNAYEIPLALEDDCDDEGGEVSSWDASLRELQILYVLIDHIQLSSCVLLHH